MNQIISQLVEVSHRLEISLHYLEVLEAAVVAGLRDRVDALSHLLEGEANLVVKLEIKLLQEGEERGIEGGQVLVAEARVRGGDTYRGVEESQT
jgi:hypothetical protein